MSRLAVQCNPAGRICAVLCDDAGILDPDPVGRMLSTCLIPSGVAHFFELLGLLEERDVVCHWMLELGGRDEPTVYHCSAARDDELVVLVGTDAVMDGAAPASQPTGQPPDQPIAQITCDDPRVQTLLDRIAERAADTGATIADLRAQIGALQYQTRSPLELENELIRVAAHDLRNPLLVVSMNCSFLLHDCEQLDDQQRGLLSDTLETSEFMTRYLDGMTSLSELWVGALALDREAIQLEELVRDTAQRHAVIAARRDITIDIARTEPIEVMADKRRLIQVLDQLFANVMKFCPAGSTARVSLERRGSEAVFALEDDGPGISPEVQPSLFRPFGKTHAESTAPQDYGAGVGLPIARRLIEAHGGRVDIDSEQDRGTRVEVTLPLAE